MKFSLATAFLALTATSAVVFAAPAQDGTAAASTYEVTGKLALGGSKIEGWVLDKKLSGYFAPPVDYPVKVDLATYVFDQWDDLTGGFKGFIKGEYLTIKYYDSEATITGKAYGDDIPEYFEFEGKTVLGY